MQDSKRCPYWDCGYCYAPSGPTDGCMGSDQCTIYAEIIATDKQEIKNDDE